MARRIRYMGATTSPGIENLPRQWWDSWFGARNDVAGSRQHLDATIGWIARAQDAGDDDGIARMFHIKSGWGASYPETTGYAIPTLLQYARMSERREFFERAIRMAEWESEVQLDSGAVRGGVITDPPSPAIFNTGQVLFGWCAAYAESQDDRFRQSAQRAASYLVEQMDSDGAWRKNLSAFTSTPLDTYAYNVRSAWALLLAADMYSNDEYREAALRNVEFVMGLCADNGWIAKNCLGRPEQPLLHTIAYAFQGLLECAVLAGLDDVVQVVFRGNRELLANLQQFGQLHGRYASDWSPTVRWRCLTGEAQTAIVWHRLHHVSGEPEWMRAADELTRQLKRTQRLSGPPGVAGGIKGSHPITGPYGRLQYLNWAAKFFADALMLELGVADAGLAG